MASLILLADENVPVIGRKLQRPRVFRDRTNPLDFLSDEEVVERYRLPRHVLYRLVEMVRANEALVTKHHFYQIAGFPNVIGAIDGTLIPIMAPKENEPEYVCRKGFHAMNVQVVADASLRFTNIVCKWPGSVHDSFIFANSELKDHMETRNDGWLLGDSAYALKKYMMTPKSNPSSVGEENYNAAHSRTRVVVERALGVCKSRFRCVHKSGGMLLFSPQKSVQIITAVAKLHNMCLDMKVPLMEYEEAVNMHDPGVHQQAQDANADQTGQAIRQRLIQRFAMN
ncbi:putative nuclease HARBI1 [Saccostrea echinata]|uniref:putative nuclease HARBI1 n=1 Tax=Saccostrea echinata TaxID=191078 RepID=UPI002A7FB2CB|nr:putative nuclease HARBI1 [Saccostrea echinata]